VANPEAFGVIGGSVVTGASSMNVLLADDHEDFLAVLVRYLQPHFEIIRTVGNGQALLEEAARLVPDVVVLDIGMPVLNGIEAARKLKAMGCPARLVFLTIHTDEDFVRAALGTGALGYVLKSDLAADLLPCLREALVGRSFVSPAIAR
jgi:DNA-binding NarL/FixJ family response regulator